MSQKCLFLVIFETNFKSFLLIYPKIIVKNDSLNSYHIKIEYYKDLSMWIGSLTTGQCLFLKNSAKAELGICSRPLGFRLLSNAFPSKQVQSSSNSSPIQLQFSSNWELEMHWSWIEIRMDLQGRYFVEGRLHLHRLPISSPSFLHRNDGPAME